MANNSEKTIDQLFKQKLENFELSSQDSSWKMLQLVKESNLRKKRFLLAKSLLEITILFSTTLLLLSSSKTTLEEPMNSPIYTVEHLQYISNSITEDNSSNKLDKTSIQKNTEKRIQKTLYSPLLDVTENKSSQKQSEDSYNGLNQQFKLEKNDKKYILTSVSSAIYKNRKQTNKVTVQKINEAGINSPFEEYAPVINQNGSFMFFTSRRPITKNEIRKGKGKERIYYTETSPSGWTKAQLLEAPLNSEENFNSAVALSNDGHHLFIYRDDHFGNGDIYESQFNGSKWSIPEALPSPINSKFHESTVSLSPDGNTLYFTSNRNGGIGGMDIWCTHKNKAGIWGKAENLGETINTKNDEEGVFIHPDGKTLYFSSRGHNGLGGYDIYYSTLENGEWSEPINLGPNINTKNDDVYFVLTADGKNAYFASVNPKTPGKKDIFKIKYNQELLQNPNNEKSSLLKGTVLTKKDKIPIDATIEIYDMKKHQLISKLECNIKTGAFSISLAKNKDYYIRIYKEGYLYYKEDLVLHSTKEPQEINKEILLDPLQENAQFILSPLLVSKNEKILEKSTQNMLDDLYQLMILNPKLKIQLLIETNSVKGPVVNNHQRVVDKCINYLKLKGIDKNRINGKIMLSVQAKEPTAKTSRLYVNIISL